MAMPETLLTVIAVRLAALVAAGLIARTAASDHPQEKISCVPDRAVVRIQPAPAAKPGTDAMLRDMLMHD